MNQLRIIGGEWKRRVIRFESVEGLRPTPDRVRETLFNWLMWEIPNSCVVDVCAGSGALGFEALSRGAAQCIFIEPHPKQARQLQDTVQQLGASSRAKIYPKTAQTAAASISMPIDVLFLDPPYALNLWQELAALYEPLLKPEAWIYVEADRSLEQLGLPSNWALHRQTKAGSVVCGLFRRDPSAE